MNSAGFAVAIKIGAQRKPIDACYSHSPYQGEEFVTLNVKSKKPPFKTKCVIWAFKLNYIRFCNFIDNITQTG